MTPAPTTRARAAGRGHTTAGEQLELSWDVPPATAATNDFICWLWAAFPAHDNGRINISRVARDLDVSRTTVRRWMAHNDPKISRAQLSHLHQRAILRGRGHYLWPALDPVSRQRSDLALEYALQCHRLITEDPAAIPPEWHKNGTLQAHLVHLVQFPRAHAYGVSATRHPKALAKIERYGIIVDQAKAPNKFAAIVLKQLTLERVDEHRCITPRVLVPTGRTETWLESAELPKLRKRLPK